MSARVKRAKIRATFCYHSARRKNGEPSGTAHKKMFDIAVTALVTVFCTGFWSGGYGFFDLFCFGAALVGAFVTPFLIERYYFPMLIELGGVESEAAGALIGCLIYDGVRFSTS